MMELEPLDPVSQELLDAARGGHAPPVGGRDRIRRGIIARVGISAFTGTALASAWIKIVVPLALLAVGGSAYFVAHRSEPPPAPITIVVAPPMSDSIEAPIIAIVPEPTATLVPPARKPIAARVVTTTSATAPVPSLDPAPPSIEEETALLLGAHGALREGDGGRALLLLDEHARRFPSGALAEERDASRVLALCALGRTGEAKTAGKAFLASHPRSPAAARVRSSCGGG